MSVGYSAIIAFAGGCSGLSLSPIWERAISYLPPPRLCYPATSGRVRSDIQTYLQLVGWVLRISALTSTPVALQCRYHRGALQGKIAQTHDPRRSVADRSISRTITLSFDVDLLCFLSALPFELSPSFLPYLHSHLPLLLASLSTYPTPCTIPHPPTFRLPSPHSPQKTNPPSLPP